jgi:FkbM family methyltransferase
MFVRMNKAEYVFRPQQLFKRLMSGSKQQEEICKLPWGHDLKVKVQDNIGKAVLNLGVYDLVVSETLARIAKLAPKDSILVDAGANIGHMSSILNFFSPITNKIFSYEPHPLVFKQLSENINYWSSKNKSIAINKALSESKGQCDFYIPSGFDGNQGLGFIASKTNEHLLSTSQVLAKVDMTTLDEEYAGKIIHLIKIDTEGSELLVLKGGQKLMDQKKIHNIVFEDHELYPTPLMTFLENNGFTLFALQRGLFGPKIAPASENIKETWEPNSFLATLYPNEISSVMKRKGWIVLS